MTLLTPILQSRSHPPQWLIELLSQPPTWAFWLTTLLLVALFALTLGLLTIVDLTDVVLAEMTTNLGILVATAAATKALVVWFSVPYLVDVAAGFLIGAVIGLGIVSPAVNAILDTGNDDTYCHRYNDHDDWQNTEH